MAPGDGGRRRRRRLLRRCCAFNSTNRAPRSSRSLPIAVLTSLQDPQAACSTAAGPCPCLLPTGACRRAPAFPAAPSSVTSRAIVNQAHAAQRRIPARGLGCGGGAPARCCRRPARGGRPWPPRPQLPAIRDRGRDVVQRQRLRGGRCAGRSSDGASPRRRRSPPPGCRAQPLLFRPLFSIFNLHPQRPTSRTSFRLKTACAAPLMWWSCCAPPAATPTCALLLCCPAALLACCCCIALLLHHPAVLPCCRSSALQASAAFCLHC